jgi:hypothetical protein
MHWVNAYGVLVAAGVVYCLIHDQLIARPRPAKGRVQTSHTKSTNHNQAA